MEIITTQHIPVLLEEVVAALQPGPNKVFLDVTCGGAGHTRALLDADPTVTVYALDWDQRAIDRLEPLKEEYGDRLVLIWASFAHLYKVSKKYKFPPFDGILADFGTSQDQIHTAEGFSFKHDTPLDMRMSLGHGKVTAFQIVNYATEEELREIFWKFGEESRTKEIVRKIIERRKQSKIRTTGELSDVIQLATGPAHKGAMHPATRIFQALRIVVNKELDNITAFLPVAFELLAKKGHLVCISFHSLEDRLVKDFYKTIEKEGRGNVVFQRPVTPSPQELTRNPSCRSSKLRVLEKI